jgi:uncharacterized coiled-coil protein SlyX
MTFEEMERGLKGLEDSATVQGAMMHRLENNLDRLETDLSRLERVVAHNGEAIGKLAGQMLVMQSALERLFERLDRFIRGLESDGHKNPQA